MSDFETIYKDYFNLVYKYLLSSTNNHDLAEELTQETFYKAIVKINTFRNDSKITTWLCQISKNLLLNYIRHNRKINILDIDDFTIISSFESVEDTVISNHEKKQLYEEIKKLDKTTQSVIIYRINGNLSFKEIADIFGKSEAWARVTFYRGKQILKEGLL